MSNNISEKEMSGTPLIKECDTLYSNEVSRSYVDKSYTEMTKSAYYADKKKCSAADKKYAEICTSALNEKKCAEICTSDLNEKKYAEICVRAYNNYEEECSASEQERDRSYNAISVFCDKYYDRLCVLDRERNKIGHNSTIKE